MRLTCPHCGLSLTVRSWTIAPSYCPRCLVRRRKVVEFIVPAEGAQAGAAPGPAAAPVAPEHSGG